MKNYVFFIMGASIALGIGLALTAPKAQATTDVCFCHDAFKKHPVTVCTDDEGLINGHQKHVDDGKDTLGACMVPTATPTVTPIVTVTGTPIPTPTEDVSPTPTPDETPIPTPTEAVKPPVVVFTGVSDGRSDGLGGKAYTPSVCNGIPAKPAILSGFQRVSPTEVRINWWASTDPHGKQAIVYGYKPNELVYGIDNLSADTTSFTIGGLAANRMTFFQVWTFRGECKSESNIIDP